MFPWTHTLLVNYHIPPFIGILQGSHSENAIGSVYGTCLPDDTPMARKIGSLYTNGCLGGKRILRKGLLWTREVFTIGTKF